MTDLNTLFARDPLDMTSEDIDAIIRAMREKRQLFDNMPVGGSGGPKALTEKQKAVASLDIKLDL